MSDNEPGVGEDRYVLDVDGHEPQQISAQEAAALARKIDVSLDEHVGRVRHSVAEGIAAGERRKIADDEFRAGGLFALLALADSLLGWSPGAYAFAAVAAVAISNALWLLLTRPQSVKPWRAER